MPLTIAGEGTPKSPFVVRTIHMEYAVLALLEKESIGQRLVWHDGRYVDVQECDDGSEVWFEVPVTSPMHGWHLAVDADPTAPAEDEAPRSVGPAADEPVVGEAPPLVVLPGGEDAVDGERAAPGDDVGEG
jgi:hypothetical protein